MRVAVSGAGGLVGSALCRSLAADGHQVVPMVRDGGAGSIGEGGIRWSIADGRLDADELRGVDAIVHLAGESIAAGRWNAARKRRILDSRVQGTRLLAETLASLVDRAETPPVLVCASGIGFYGDRGDAWVDASSPRGEGFLADVCWRWEAAAEAARQAGVRVVHARFGMVLSRHGGALARMLPPFRLGGGAVLGDGRQWVSWIHLDDAVGALRHVLDADSLAGPLNVVSEEPVTQRQMARALGRALSRPVLLRLPAAAVRLAFGEMGEELLLASTRVDGSALRENGFRLRFQSLESALRQEVGAP